MGANELYGLDARIQRYKERVLDKQDGKEILFVENSEKHARAASVFGWWTFLYDSKNPSEASAKLLEFFEGL
jgi:hypothetical protein